MLSAHEQLSAQFWQWERCGRGWQVFAKPVTPEPPFTPFAYRSLADAPIRDTTSRPSFLGSLFRKVAVPTPAVEPPPADDEMVAATPVVLVREKIIELQVTLPADLDMEREAFAQLFHSLSYCREPISFELLGTHDRVVAQFAASPADISILRRQLAALFPAAQFREVPGALSQALEASRGDGVAIIDFGLESEFMLPLATGKIDPFIGIVTALAGLEAGELALFQVLWQPVREAWAESIVNSLIRGDGKPLFVNAPELTRAAEEKVSRPLYAAVVRVLLRSDNEYRLSEIAREFAGSLCAFSDPQGNALIPLNNDGYPFEAHLADVILRQTRRSGMILNADELTGFVHLPSSAVHCAALLRVSDHTKAVPDLARHSNGLCLGDNEHNGETTPVYLSLEQRTRHTHIIGSNGTGKSSLLLNLMQQDIANGDGFALLDPHGDLSDDVLGIIPDERLEDVIYFDPSDADFPIGFNILQAHSEDEKVLLASDLIAVLRRFSTSWGDTMDAVMQNAILAFLESGRGGTLADLREFLQNDSFRSEFLKTVADPEIAYFWRELFPQLGGRKSVTSVLMRLQDFFSRKPLRNIVSQRDNRLDFADIMDNGKIFIARLPGGLNGAENTRLLGTLLAMKFQQTAMTRQSQKAADRRDFWLYIDEFDEFIAPSVAKILTGARKYKLGLTLAHQKLQALHNAPDVESAVLSQPCTRIVFNVGSDDARRLANGFTFFDAEKLGTLEKYHAAVRVERNDGDFNLAVRTPERPPEAEAEARRQRVIALSRSKYAASRAEVEAAWLAALSATIPPESNIGRPKPVSKMAAPPATFVAKAAEPSAGVAETPQSAELPDDAGILAASQAERKHEAMKRRIAAEAESLDYTVEQERDVPPHGRVDLILTRGGRAIACEVSDTTPPEIEADHIRHRLAAGFAHVAVIADSPRKLGRIRELCDNADDPRVGFHSPMQFIQQLYAWAAADPLGGERERAKPQKRKFNPPDGGDGRQSSDRRMLDEISGIMGRDRKRKEGAG